MTTPKNSHFKGFATTILLVLISIFGYAAQKSIDTGLKASYVSIDDYVWTDKNKKDLLDTDDTEVQGVKVALYASDAKENSMVAGNTITLKYINTAGSLIPKTNFVKLTKANEKDIYSITSDGKTTKEDDDDKVRITTKSVEFLADLSLNKTVSNLNPSTGDQITYLIEVKNIGISNTTNVEVTDAVPTGLQIISINGADGVTITGNTVVAKFIQINVGQIATFQIVAKVIATTGTIKNWAEVTKSDQKDPNSTPNNGVDKNEDDDDDAEITIKQPVCNPTTPFISCLNPYICLGESV